MIKKKIAILLPYKENYTENYAGAASIWVKDYLSLSNYGTFDFHQPSKFATFIFKERSYEK